MQPQTPHAKPVMDVAAPPRPNPPATPASPAPTPATLTQPVAVAPAPDADKDAAPTNASTPNLPTLDDEPEKSTPVLAPPKQPKKPALDGPHAPVALITVTVLIMLALSGIAVLIYVTSNS
jgi:hypothetical protein